MALRLDGYIRQSDQKREDSFSPPEQRRKIKQWAALRGVEIANWEEDINVPGGTLVRPGLEAILDRIRTGATGGIAVARLDRLSRAGVGDALKLIEEVHGHGGEIAAVDLGIDPATETGEFAMTIMLALARMERRRIQANWLTAQAHSVAQGIHPGGPSLGYDRDQDTKRLVPNSDAPIRRDLTLRRGAGDSWTELTRWLNAARPRDDGSEWTRQTVRTLVESRVTLGMAYHGKAENPHAHPPLVTRDEWEAAQANGGSRTPRGTYLLSGIVRCSSCGCTMRGTKNGRSRVYKCEGYSSAGSCPDRYMSIIVDRLDAFVTEQFFAGLEAFEVRAVESGSSAAEARAELERLEGERDAFAADTRARGALGDKAWYAALEARGRAVSDAQAALHSALRSSPVANLPDVGDKWADLNLEERRSILKAALDCVFVRRSLRGTGGTPVSQRARVLFRGEGPADLPGTGRHVDFEAFAWDDDPNDVRMAAA